MATEEQEFVPPESMDQVPQDRVFCTAVLFLTPDNRIAGALDYAGDRLADVPALVGAECKCAADHLERYLRRAIDHAATEVGLLGQILEAFNIDITEEDLEQSDDDSDGEQANAAS